MRLSACLHWLLAAYLWAVEWIPLGNWNRQKGERLLVALLNGHAIASDDIFTMAFVTAPAVVFWIAYTRRNVWFAFLTIILDLVWLAMQIQSWWIPYIFGARLRWQIQYAHGPTTKVLPSFGSHVAPDGMHFVITVLLVAGITTAVYGIRQLLASRRVISSAQQSEHRVARIT